MIDRAGLADFLRRRRALLRPADVGLPPGARRRTPGLRREEVAALAGAHVRDLRATWSRRSGDADVTALVADLCTAGIEFAALWERHEVAERRADRKRFHHPEVGLVSVTCEVLLTPDFDLAFLHGPPCAVRRHRVAAPETALSAV